MSKQTTEDDEVYFNSLLQVQLLPPTPPPPACTPSDDPTFIEKEELYDEVINTVVIQYSEEILAQLNIRQKTQHRQNTQHRNTLYEHVVNKTN